MEYDLFRNKVQQVKAKKPILFALETDTPPSIDKIEDFEKIYRMVLPEKYKLFIIEFGGGYFGYANIYSLDNSSNYFIMNISHLCQMVIFRLLIMVVETFMF